MPRTHYTCQRALVDGLMDFQARLIEREKHDRAEMRRLTALASVLEAARRKDGDPERIADMLALNAGTSSAAS